MQFTNFGFALGFFLISLGLPLDYSGPEKRYSGLEESFGEESDRGAPCSSRSNGCKNSCHHIWSDLLADIDLFNLPYVRSAHGYRRISANNVLEHEIRRKIFDLICRYPGIDLTRLAQLSGCNESTLRYHVDRIAEEKCISIFDEGKSFHFFENHHTFSYTDQLFLSRYSSGLTGRILQLIYKAPGITRKEIADRLGIASPTVTRTVRHLVDDRCVQLVKDGRFTRHYLSGESFSAIHRLNPA